MRPDMHRRLVIDALEMGLFQRRPRRGELIFHSDRGRVARSGLDPVHQDSGTSVHKPSRISRASSRHRRRALYMPALAAVRWDPHLKAFYNALLARHKRKLQALIAVARKLLHAIYGILRTRTPYDGSKLPAAGDRINRTIASPSETEAGSAGKQPRRGITWWAHPDDEPKAGRGYPRSAPDRHRRDRPNMP